MSRGIFLVHSENQLVEMREQKYDTEDRLQTLLENYPNLLAGDQIDPAEPRRWVLIKREAAIADRDGGNGRWFVDHLLLDQDGIPTLVEVKRSTDTRIRREVVGQMLDYAANIVLNWPPDDLYRVFHDTCRTAGLEPDQVLESALGPTFDTTAFWQLAKTNLQAGRVRLVFVADVIPNELKTVVEFLNKQMDPAEVLAVEIRQYTADGFQTLVPTVIGQTAEAQNRKSATSRESRQWDEESFFSELLERQGIDAVRAARTLLDWSRQNTTRVWWGQGSVSGSFVPVLRHNGVDHQLFAIYTYGSCEVHFQYLERRPPFDSLDLRRELQERLNRIPSVHIPDDALSRRPSIPLQTLSNAHNTQAFVEAYSWVVETIQQA